MLRADYAELEEQLEAFSTKNHVRFLSEALTCLRQSRDPVAPFELLSRIQGREKEEAALSAVRTWLKNQLDRSRISADDLELRLVWARRIARIVGNRRANSPSRENSRRGPGSQDLAQQLKILRQKYPKPPPLPPPPCPPLFAPRPLPRVLKVMFKEHKEAIKALKSLHALSGGAPARPRQLALAAPDGHFPLPTEFGRILLDCTASTPGLAEYLKELQGPRHGSAFPFFVAGFARDDDKLLARELHLTMPEDLV